MEKTKHCIQSFKEFVADIKEDWVIQNYVRGREINLLYGEAFSGKSFTALDMALTVACPEVKTWHGVPVKHGTVLYFTNSAETNRLKRRSVWWALYHKATLDRVDMAFSNAGNFYSPGVMLSAISAELKTPPVLVVIDKLEMSSGGGFRDVDDEKNYSDTKILFNSFQEIAWELKCAILLTHNFMDDKEVRECLDQTFPWWLPYTDTALLTERLQGTRYISLTQSRSRDSILAPKMNLNFKQVGEDGAALDL